MHTNWSLSKCIPVGFPHALIACSALVASMYRTWVVKITKAFQTYSARHLEPWIFRLSLYEPWTFRLVCSHIPEEPIPAQSPSSNTTGTRHRFALSNETLLVWSGSIHNLLIYCACARNLNFKKLDDAILVWGPVWSFRASTVHVSSMYMYICSTFKHEYIYTRPLIAMKTFIRWYPHRLTSQPANLCCQLRCEPSNAISCSVVRWTQCVAITTINI